MTYNHSPSVNTNVKNRPPLQRTRPGDPNRPAPYLAGVASGLSVHLNIKVKYIRWALVISTFIGFIGLGAILYAWLWATIKETSSDRTYTNQRLAKKQNEINTGWQSPSSIQGFLIAGVFLLITLLGISLLQGWWEITNWISGIGITFIGILITWTQTQRMRTWYRIEVFIPLSIGMGMQILGSLVLVTSAHFSDTWISGAAMIIVSLMSISIAIAPLGLNLVGDLRQTRIKQIRETERADIAAHLHDSVLQTLTLIKANSTDAAKVRSLAIRQERELRAWLYTGVRDTASSYSEQLRQTITEIEATYGAEVEMVCVGDTQPGPNELTIIAATAEAVKNAVRHATPPIRVYSEIRPESIEVYVRDHGAGFKIEDVAADRQGVRESIIGRMHRAGGNAKIRTLEVGTEIQLKIAPSEKEK